MMSAKHIEVSAKVVEKLYGNHFLAELDNGYKLTVYLSGKMRLKSIEVSPGDKVTLHISPYDLKRGIIVAKAA